MEEITINPLLSARRRAVTKEDNCDAQLGSCRDNKRQPERLNFCLLNLFLNGYLRFGFWL